MSSINQTPVNQVASQQLQYFINLSQMQAVVSRRFDHMGSMVGFTDFMVLYHLSQADGQKMRRIDLAEKMGMTASGVTRVLLPMEKLRLVGRESNPRDGRVSMARLTSGGRRILEESMERAETIATDLIAPTDIENIPVLMRVNEDIRRAAL